MMIGMLSRGKCVDTEEWVEGYLVAAKDYDKTVYIIIPVDAQLYGGVEFDRGWRIDPETIKQCARLTEDAVQVVRCKNCEHYDERFNPNTKNYCYVDGGPIHRIMPPDGFCSDGKRKC